MGTMSSAYFSFTMGKPSWYCLTVSRRKLKKLLSEAGYEKVQNLLDINIADRLGMYNPLQNSSDLSDSYYLKELLDEIQNSEGQFKKSDLAIS